MDMNEYALEALARDRLADLRANAQRAKESRLGGRSSRPLRVAVGHALIRMGRRLQGPRRYSWVGHATK